MRTNNTDKVTLQEIVTKVEKLPSLPQAALRLTQMMENPNVSAEQLAEVIRLDPDLTTQVLRLCNSAAYGLSRKISTVKEAVAMLGLNTLRSLVYVIISKFALDRPVDGYGLERGALWLNALTCAVYAKHLAEQRRLVDPELAFTGALLRDIGKIVLGEFVGVSYRNIEEAALEKQIDFVEAEQEIIGFSHTEVGRRIAEKWNLPAQLVRVIRYHHKPSLLAKDPVGAGDVKLVTMVHLADAFTMMIGSSIGSDGLMYSLDMQALDSLGIDITVDYMETTLGRLSELDGVIQSLAESLRG